MNPNILVVDGSYRQYTDLLLRHHLLLVQGKEDDAETEMVEEAMSQLWERLDEAQRRSLAGLGSDLNWARRRCQLAPRGRQPEEVTAEDLQALRQAQEEKNWHGLLHQLRLCAPRTPPSQLASWRASAWDALQFPQLASVFLDLTANLEVNARS